MARSPARRDTERLVGTSAEGICLAQPRLRRMWNKKEIKYPSRRPVLHWPIPWIEERKSYQFMPRAPFFHRSFVVVEKLQFFRTQTINFLNNTLNLTVNPKSDKILKPSQGLKFLGIKFWPSERNLNKRSLARVHERLNSANLSSYSGLIKSHCNKKKQKYFNWMVLEKLTDHRAS